MSGYRLKRSFDPGTKTTPRIVGASAFCVDRSTVVTARASRGAVEDARRARGDLDQSLHATVGNWMDAQKLFSHVSVFITTARDYRTLGTGVLTADCTDEYPIKPPAPRLCCLLSGSYLRHLWVKSECLGSLVSLPCRPATDLAGNCSVMPPEDRDTVSEFGVGRLSW